MSKHTGRPKGLTNLSEERKASIVAAKNLQIFSHQRIAEDHNVSRQTVLNLSEDKLSPEGKKQLQSFVDKLKTAREKVIDRINEKLDNNDFKDGVYPNLLNAVNQNYRLETNQSTANINVQETVLHGYIASGLAADLAEAEALYKALESGEIVDGETA